MRIKQAVGTSHVGGRELNEDAVLRLSKVPMYAVADGMGGAGGGEVAASIAVDVVRRHAPVLREQNLAVAKERSTHNRLALGKLMDQLFNMASREIAAEGKRRSKADIGSTLVLATVVGRYAYVAHVGHCRAYLLRDGKLLRLTEDHSLAELRLRRGKINREQYEGSPDRHVLYQCLGAGFDVDVDLAEVRLRGQDVLVLCSDGLPRALSDDTIAELIEPGRMEQSLNKLLEQAVAQGASDNVSAVLIEMESDTEDVPRRSIVNTLKQVYLFELMTHQELLLVAPYLEDRTAGKGTTIFDEGEQAEDFYVVISGQVRILRGRTRIEDVQSGGHFGDLALARPIAHNTSAVAVSDTRMFALSRSAFHELSKQRPDLGVRLSMTLLGAVGDRVRDLSERLYTMQRGGRESK